MIIMDLNMKIMNGDEAIKKVKIYFIQIKVLVKNENYQDAYIVGHTSDDDQSVFDLFKKSGVDEIL